MTKTTCDKCGSEMDSTDKQVYLGAFCRHAIMTQVAMGVTVQMQGRYAEQSPSEWWTPHHQTKPVDLCKDCLVGFDKHAKVFLEKK